MAIEEHVQNSMDGEIARRLWYELPVYYKGNADSVVAPGETIEWPDYSSIMDYELEIAAVIGKRGRDIPAEEAEVHRRLHRFQRFQRPRYSGAGDGRAIGPREGKDFANGLGPLFRPARRTSTCSPPR